MRPAIYKNYLLVILTVLLLFNYLDRVALGVVLQDIKIDLQLSDTQLGLMSGIAFALFYSVMGIPIARWADRGNRVMIISVTAALWSVAVAFCGLIGTFAQLLLVRIGVAVGEAGCIPPASSLIADYFSRAERPRASAIYAMGGALSFLVGYFVAGWLNELYGWRVTFMVLASPGLALSALAWLTLKEPRKMTPSQRAKYLPSADPGPAPMEHPSMREVCGTLWANRTFRHLLLCLSVNYFFGYGIVQWQPAFLARSYGLSSGEIGSWLAVTVGLGGLAGTYLGGEWATRYAANNERLQLKAMTIAMAISGVVGTVLYSSTNKYWTFGLTALVEVGQYMVYAPLFATIQTLVPERIRAVSFALVYLVANFIGMGLGPLAAGALSDALRPWAGDESLRYALLALAPGYFWCAWHLWLARRTVASDIAATDSHRLHAVDGSRLEQATRARALALSADGGGTTG